MFDRQTQVREIMTENVITVAPNTVMTEVVQLFRTHHVHHIPVADGGKVVGMISTADVNRLEHHFTLFKTQEAEEVNAAVFSSMLAKEVMAPHVVTVRATDTAQFAADIFKENLFRAMPVVDDQRKIIGIVTPYDLMVYAYRTEPGRLT